MTDLRDLLHAVADESAATHQPVVDWVTPLRAARRRQRQRRTALGAAAGLVVVGMVATTLATAAHQGRPEAVVAGVPDAVRAAESAVVKVTGIALSCSKRAQETGFIVAPHRVITSAHVLSGVTDDVQVATADGRVSAAVVVLYDVSRDIAMLKVDDLADPPLEVDDSASAGDPAYIVGYPEDGAVRTRESAISAHQTATGPDIYQEGTATRDIYALRGPLTPGETGGPVVSSEGRVVGMIFARAVDSPDASYALTAAELASAIRAAESASLPVSTRSCIPS